MTSHAVPASALPAWDALNRALSDYRPPCASSPDMWFATSEEDVRRAATRCRVLAACDRYATAARETVGVWAGVDRERRAKPPHRETSA